MALLPEVKTSTTFWPTQPDVTQQLSSTSSGDPEHDHVDGSCFVFLSTGIDVNAKIRRFLAENFSVAGQVLWFDKYPPRFQCLMYFTFLFTRMLLCILTIHGTFSSAVTAEGGLLRNHVYFYALRHVFPK